MYFFGLDCWTRLLDWILKKDVRLSMCDCMCSEDLCLARSYKRSWAVKTRCKVHHSFDCDKATNYAAKLTKPIARKWTVLRCVSMQYQKLPGNQTIDTRCNHSGRSLISRCQKDWLQYYWNIASSPGLTQILSRSRGERSGLRDKIWVGPGDEANRNKRVWYWSES